MYIKYVICFCSSCVSNFSQFSTLGFCLLHVVFFCRSCYCFCPLDLYGFLIFKATSLKARFCYSNMHWHSKALLLYVIIVKMWHYKAPYLLQEPGQFAKQWWRFCHQLLLRICYQPKLGFLENTPHFIISTYHAFCRIFASMVILEAS